MDLKVAFVIVCLFALAITCTDAVIPKCCMKTAKHINRRWLLMVERSYVQHSSGACDISALILFMKGRSKPLCAPLKVKKVLDHLQKRRKRHSIKTGS